MRMQPDGLWSHEERFWTNDEAFYEDALDAGAVMVFKAPVGILVGREIIDRVSAAPRWERVDMSERRLNAPSEGIVTLAYRAEARREGVTSEPIYCSSTYRRDGEAWKLVQHQQTPA
jgi:hypothetical protein